MLRHLLARVLRNCLSEAQREFIAFHAAAPLPHEWTWLGCGHPSQTSMLAAMKPGAVVFIHHEEMRPIARLFRPGFRLRRLGRAIAWCLA